MFQFMGSEDFLVWNITALIEYNKDYRVEPGMGGKDGREIEAYHRCKGISVKRMKA